MYSNKQQKEKHYPNCCCCCFSIRLRVFAAAASGTIERRPTKATLCLRQKRFAFLWRVSVVVVVVAGCTFWLCDAATTTYYALPIVSRCPPLAHSFVRALFLCVHSLTVHYHLAHTFYFYLIEWQSQSAVPTSS